MSLEVGQRVWIDSVNRRGAPLAEGRIVKLGRLLVTIRSNRYATQVFRIEGRHTNDQFGHEWFLTDAELAERVEVEALTARLDVLRFRVDPTRTDSRWKGSARVLRGIVDLLEAQP